MPWTFFDSSGRKLNTSSTLIDNLDIDGATDIGADIADADLFIIDDNAGGTNRKTAASRLKTYIGSAGVTREGGQTTEASTTSTTAVDLLAATSLTLAGAEPALLLVNGRKTTGAASIANIGLKLNSTVVFEASNGSSSGICFMGAQNEVQNVSAGVTMNPRITNYTVGRILGSMGVYNAANGAQGTQVLPAGGADAAFPTAEITSNILRGETVSASQSLSSDVFHVYAYAAS